MAKITTKVSVSMRETFDDFLLFICSPMKQAANYQKTVCVAPFQSITNAEVSKRQASIYSGIRSPKSIWLTAAAMLLLCKGYWDIQLSI